VKTSAHPQNGGNHEIGEVWELRQGFKAHKKQKSRPKKMAAHKKKRSAAQKWKKVLGRLPNLACKKAQSQIASKPME